MPNDEESTLAPPAVVVAVCASAVSTGSLEHVLTRLPPQPEAAVIVVLQRREALDEDGFARALAGAGRETVTILDGVPVEAGKIYLPAPGTVVTVEDNRFHTRPAEQAPGERGVIDTLLVSLARDEDGRCIAVALAGTDGDGTLGVKAIKQESGLALAEETAESAAGDLAMSSSPAAGADAVLPRAELTARLAALIGQVARAKGRAPDVPGEKAALGSIAAVLRSRTGHDFHGYKPSTFLRRVQRRMQVAQLEDVQRYVELLRAQPEEAQNLFNDLLIGVTAFFRDAREFEVFERAVVPKLFENKTANDQLRVWVVGCSTGEEAYSIAILLRERMARLDETPHVQIFATDLDGRALAAARTGRYADAIAKTMPPERLARWFSKEGDTFCVARELREMCIFSQHSIIKDPPFSRLDLVSCRNLLIYLEPALQARVIPLFHFALNPGGVVFLGNSENASRHTGLFAPVEPRSRIFRRLDTAARVLPDLPFAAVGRRLDGAGSEAAPGRPRPAAGSLARRAERFAERYAPAFVLVDGDHNAVQFFGRTGRYIDPAGGVASLNILQLVHPDLRIDLRAALAQAAEDGRTVQVENLRVGLNGSRLSVDLVVEPIRADDATSFVVLFRDGTAVSDADDGGASPSAVAQGEHARLLEAELRVTKDRLQATIEELESTNEELKSSNEEYQSLNEELQSANEELQTSKEELQSVNEELTTVNGELAHRVQELGRANSDLKNLLESTQIATVFLDNDLKVTNFTPAAADVFHLVEADIGRPIGHIKPRILYEDLQDDARRVLRSLHVVEREIGTPQAGAIYMVRMLPYRSTDNVIAGVVLTFMDVSARRQAEERLRESEAKLAADLAGMRRLYDLHARLATETDLKAALGEILAVACEFTGTDRGCMQLVGEHGGRLEMFAWRGYADDGPFISRLRDEGPKQGRAGARVKRQRLVIEDTQTHPMDDADREAALADGVRAVQSTPVVGRKGETVGVLSTQFREPHRPSEDELRLVDLLAWTAVDFVDRHRAEAALRESEARHRAELEQQVRERTAELKQSRDLIQATMDSSLDMIQVFEAVRDEAGEIVDFRWLLNNHTSESRYGEVRGQSLLERNPGVVTEGIFDIFKHVTATGEPHQTERYYAHEQFDGWFFQSVAKLGDGVATVTKEITEWKEAQKEMLRLRDEVTQAKLRESEERLSMVLKAARMGTYDWDSDGHRPTLSDMSYEVFGLLPGQPFSTSEEGFGLIHAEDRARHQAIFKRAGAQGEDFHSIYRVVRPRDGRIAWIEEQGSGSRDPETGITHLRGVHWDVTEREEALLALRASEERFRGFAENSADVLWIADAQGERLAYLSPAFERVFGEGRDAVMADLRRWQDLVHPEDRGAIAALMSRTVGGEAAIAHYRVVRPADGRVAHLRDTGFPIRDAAGAITHVAGIVQDITDLERTAAALRAETERFRTLAEGIPQLVWRANAEGLWTWASPQWQDYTGQSQDGSHGWGWLGAVHPDDRTAATRAWEQARPHGRLDVEYRVRRAGDGAWRWFSTRSVPLRDAPEPGEPEGRVVEWLGTTTDIDDLKRLQGQQQVLVAELQHRTRNLLAVVRNVARRSIGPSPERDEYDARLATLGRVQGFLSRSPDYTVPLADLVGAELAATGDGDAGKVTVAGPAIELPGEGVQAVALALHELVTNAVKYGALAQAAGRLSVTWRVDGGDGAGPCLVIEWRESEVAMPGGGPPTRRGYGSELITRALPYQLQAETALEFAPDGVRCRISLPAGAFRCIGKETQA